MFIRLLTIPGTPACRPALPHGLRKPQSSTDRERSYAVVSGRGNAPDARLTADDRTGLRSRERLHDHEKALLGQFVRLLDTSVHAPAPIIDGKNQRQRGDVHPA